MRFIQYLCRLLCIVGLLPLMACSHLPVGTEEFTIGILNTRSSLEQMVQTFKAGMVDLGYVEGETIHYLYSGQGNIPAEEDGAAKAFVAAKVDLIFALGTPAALAAQQAVKETEIPVVFAPLNDPLRFGMVKSLTHPGGNMTGIRTGGYVPKELEWLLQLAPNTKRLFVPHDPNDDISVQSLATLEETAKRFRVEVVVHAVSNATEIEQALATLPADIDALLILPTTLALEHIDQFAATARARRLPLAVPSFPYVKAGALVSYGSDYAAIGTQVSRLADKILHGVSPADLPVETAEFYLGLNLQTAITIGLPLSNEMIQQAKFIER